MTSESSYKATECIWSVPVAPVAAQSTAQICGRSPAEIVGSNLAVGMDVNVF